MSERMTSVTLRARKREAGYADWGRRSRAEMIAWIRRIAQKDLERAQAILAADDSEFLVETYVGVHVQRNKEEVLE